LGLFSEADWANISQDCESLHTLMTFPWGDILQNNVYIQPGGYTSPPNCQPNRDGNRFPLARRQGFLHAPPPFSTTPPLGPPATAERRQD
jgi:hypothetical protein